MPRGRATHPSNHHSLLLLLLLNAGVSKTLPSQTRKLCFLDLNRDRVTIPSQNGKQRLPVFKDKFTHCCLKCSQLFSTDDRDSQVCGKCVPGDLNNFCTVCWAITSARKGMLGFRCSVCKEEMCSGCREFSPFKKSQRSLCSACKYALNQKEKVSKVINIVL